MNFKEVKNLITYKLNQTLFLCLIMFCLPFSVFAFEDCMIFGKDKLTDIRIEHNDVVDVYPFFTLENKKNILYVRPLKTGKTTFTVLRNGKKVVLFDVQVNEFNTVIKEVDGFEILTVDTLWNSKSNFILDEPPTMLNNRTEGK